MKTRMHFLDNLRTLMIFLVVVLHAGIVYEPILQNSWIVSDPDKINELGLVRMYLDLFIMFMLFFISGFFAAGSLRKKSGREFIMSKFRRIFVPWLIAVLLLIPAYKIVFLWSRDLPQQVWYSYFHVFNRSGGDPSFFADNPVQNWLWFLPVLFLFQLIYLGLSKTRLLSMKISLARGVALTFVVGVAYGMTIYMTGMRGWYHSALLHFQNDRLLIYFLVFLLGSLCYKLKVFESDKKNLRLYILSNITLTVSLGIFTAVALNLFFNLIDPGRNYFIVSEIADHLLYYAFAIFSMLNFLFILLYSFRFSANKTNRLLTFMSRNSYMVYIIHMIVLGLIAMILMKTTIPAGFKYALLIIFTFAISNLVALGLQWTARRPVSAKSLVTVLYTGLLLVAIIFWANKKSQSPVGKFSAQSPPEISLHEASYLGNIKAIEKHILAGSDPDAKDAIGNTPLMIAAIFGHTKAAGMLIEAGADLNITNSEGSTALHVAAFFCRTEIVNFLLESGADKQIRNHAGATPFESVAGPFNEIKPVYDYFGQKLNAMGLQLDYRRIEETRPNIAQILK